MKSTFYCHGCMCDRPATEFSFSSSSLNYCKKHVKEKIKHEAKARSGDARSMERIKAKQKAPKVDKAYIERKRQILFERELAEIEQEMVSYDY